MYDLERCADLPEPNYVNGGRIAQFYANQRVSWYTGEVTFNPHIWSHARGGIKYRLTA